MQMMTEYKSFSFYLYKKQANKHKFYLIFISYTVRCVCIHVYLK